MCAKCVTEDGMRNVFSVPAAMRIVLVAAAVGTSLETDAVADAEAEMELVPNAINTADVWAWNVTNFFDIDDGIAMRSELVTVARQNTVEGAPTSAASIRI